MFKDYYKILGVSLYATSEEIKKAYRENSLKWHPDKNPEINVISKMQDINEAYAILKDRDKRQRYDIEYLRFNSFVSNLNKDSKEEENSKEKYRKQDEWDYKYDVQDKTVEDDIIKAREYAQELVNEFMRNIKDTSIIAAKGAAKSVVHYTIGWIIAGIFISIISLMIRTCN